VTAITLHPLVHCVFSTRFHQRNTVVDPNRIHTQTLYFIHDQRGVIKWSGKKPFDRVQKLFWTKYCWRIHLEYNIVYGALYYHTLSFIYLFIYSELGKKRKISALGRYKNARARFRKNVSVMHLVLRAQRHVVKTGRGVSERESERWKYHINAVFSFFLYFFFLIISRYVYPCAFNTFH
jgi:hypothetical protein